MQIENSKYLPAHISKCTYVGVYICTFTHCICYLHPLLILICVFHYQFHLFVKAKNSLNVAARSYQDPIIALTIKQEITTFKAKSDFTLVIYL